MREGTPTEVFAAFLRLGLTSFGGPIAHLERSLFSSAHNSVEKRAAIGAFPYRQRLLSGALLPYGD